MILARRGARTSHVGYIVEISPVSPGSVLRGPNQLGHVDDRAQTSRAARIGEIFGIDGNQNAGSVSFAMAPAAHSGIGPFISLGGTVSRDIPVGDSWLFSVKASGKGMIGAVLSDAETGQRFEALAFAKILTWQADGPRAVPSLYDVIERNGDVSGQLRNRSCSID